MTVFSTQPSSIHPPNLLTPKSKLQSFKENCFHPLPASVAILISTQTKSGYISFGNNWLELPAIPIPASAEKQENHFGELVFFLFLWNITWMKPDLLIFIEKLKVQLFCARGQHQNKFMFTARVLSRPQHGMWPTRRFNGPFLFPNHLILSPLTWKPTRLKPRDRN